MFISFEGADCSGKTTQIDLVAKQLEDKGYSCYVLKTPSLEKSIDSFKNIDILKILDIYRDDVKFFLYLARETTIEEKIQDFLQIYDFVLTDRSIDSTLVYNKLLMNFRGPKVLYDKLLKIYYQYYLKPNLTFIFTASQRDFMQRLDKRNKLRIYEKIPLIMKIQKEFINLAKKDKRFVIINTTNTNIEGTSSKIADAILRRKKCK